MTIKQVTLSAAKAYLRASLKNCMLKETEAILASMQQPKKNE